jgi:hypothetical protein
MKRFSLWGVIVALVFLIAIALAVSIEDEKSYTDAEVLYAAGQVKFMGVTHPYILRHKQDGLDLDLYVKWAKADEEVQKQLERNRAK